MVSKNDLREAKEKLNVESVRKGPGQPKKLPPDEFVSEMKRLSREAKGQLERLQDEAEKARRDLEKAHSQMLATCFVVASFANQAGAGE